MDRNRSHPTLVPMLCVGTLLGADYRCDLTQSIPTQKHGNEVLRRETVAMDDLSSQISPSALVKLII